MKKNIFSILGMALLLFSTLFFAVSCSDDDEPQGIQEVAIPDPLLLAQVKIALGLGVNETVNTQNILGLDTLNLDASSDISGTTFGDIEDLTGLEFAENLVYLHLGATSVTDLTPIKDLEKISYLRINNTAITDLSPIAGFTSLTYFNANTVRGITDISPLAGNTGLKEIILRDVPFGNAGMATIRNFTVLYRINMRSTGVTDITVLGELMEEGALLDSTPGAAAAGGADLDLRGLEVDDWSPIEPFLEQISNIEGYPG